MSFFTNLTLNFTNVTVYTTHTYYNRIIIKKKYSKNIPGFLNVYLAGSRFFSKHTCLRMLLSCVFGLIRDTYNWFLGKCTYKY